MRNAADETQVKRSAEADKFQRDQELRDMKTILEYPFGRRLVWRYLGLAGVFKLSFTGNSETFFNEGQRNIGLKLLADVMEAKPDAYQIMAEEAKKEEEKRIA